MKVLISLIGIMALLLTGCGKQKEFSNIFSTHINTNIKNKEGLREIDVIPAYRGALSLYKQEFSSLTKEQIREMEKKAQKYNLLNTINKNGILLIPHVRIKDDGYMLIAVIDAILKSKKKKILFISLAHQRTQLLEKEHDLMGNHPFLSKDMPSKLKYLRGVFTENSIWGSDHSIYEFKNMLKLITNMRGIKCPEVKVRFINLTGLDPSTLPGIQELIKDYKSKDYAMVTTGDLCHHGIHYKDKPNSVYKITDKKGLSILKNRIKISLKLLDKGKYKKFIKYSYAVTHSDWADAGVAIRYILGPTKSTIISTKPSDFSDLFKTKSPTYVLGALVSIIPTKKSQGQF